jgi:hypothetical protein
LDRDSLLVFCIEQHDALTVEYDHGVRRLRQSLSHEVSYDRSQTLADAHTKFVREARNYRYLLESCLSAPSSGSKSVTVKSVLELVASIDWLFVLYEASDVLHNGIDVAGMRIDTSFIPEVFYSSAQEKHGSQFEREMADSTLGVGLDSEDRVTSTSSGNDMKALDGAFFRDTGFSFSHLSQTLGVLSCWQTARGEKDLFLSYRASPADIARVLLETIETLSPEEARRLIGFTTLDPAQVRRLLGKAVDESDVPVWDHNKRGSRYAIRPLIPLDDGTLAWGASAADRALRIWTMSIANGYMPADFSWQNVKEGIRTIKSGLERQLEVRASEVCARITSHVVHGMDFKDRFPKEQFDDVGDFDALAYLPQSNRWLIVECKYNQPAFCLKDARRLRERIFGSEADRGQFAKIERRRDFLNRNLNRLRELLGWSAPETGEGANISEIYVSRDIYWWMRNTPYEVPTHFVRIDALETWLRSNGFFASPSHGIEGSDGD